MDNLVNFQQLRNSIIESKNKVAFLVESFKKLHSDALPEDLDGNLGGRIARLYILANKDYVRVLQAVWMSSACGIRGSHLNYIQKMIEKKNENVKKVVKSLPRTSVKELADKASK